MTTNWVKEVQHIFKSKMLILVAVSVLVSTAAAAAVLGP